MAQRDFLTTMMIAVKWNAWLLFACLLLNNCSKGPWNDPYPEDDPKSKTFYTSFSERPNHLDPARSYSSNEWVITNQVYEPVLQYHYLKRPYVLEPLIAEDMPRVHFLDSHKNRIEGHPPQDIAYSVYTITIKPNILYQPHPAFAKTQSGQPMYQNLSEEDLEGIHGVNDFKVKGTRELTAEDFVYQIKRLADPKNSSPVFGLLAEYIVGFNAFRQTLKKEDAQRLSTFRDLNAFALEGVKTLSRYQYQIVLKGQYPQFIYWLAMPFFAPMPYEAVRFYDQVPMKEKNITLDWYPIGTGPFLMTQNNPNLIMVLERNPNYRGERFPSVGEPIDEQQGILSHQGQRLPFIDKVVFTLEKENIPYWNKFLQGYYDSSGISSDSFDQALQATGTSHGLELSSALKEKHIRLKTQVLPSVYYWGFNMLDDRVGGSSNANKYLRQAISIAVDIEEYIKIFLNGRGMTAHSLLPPGIFGFQETQNDFNPIVFEKQDNGTLRRKALSKAQVLMEKAGYPQGIDPQTQQPLVLYLDAVSGGGPDTKARYAWLRKQFKKIGIDLIVRTTQYNRFQEKMKNGDAQIFSWGWNADYPDPENFLFLLLGSNGKVKFDGENAANYQNAQYDALFKQMKIMPNGPERQALILQMLSILRDEAPWIWGYHPLQYSLNHTWLEAHKPNAMSRNTLKYLKVDPVKRFELRELWNAPIMWPIGWVLLGVCVLLIPAFLKYWQNEYRPLKKWPFKDHS